MDSPRAGERLLDLVAVMDRLRSPGGCPWDARQTHESLVEYLVEEAYETVEAIEEADRDGLREELGDLLLQVVFHARIASEDARESWDIDDVADGIVTKLIAPTASKTACPCSSAEPLGMSAMPRAWAWRLSRTISSICPGAMLCSMKIFSTSARPPASPS